MERVELWSVCVRLDSCVELLHLLEALLACTGLCVDERHVLVVLGALSSICCSFGQLLCVSRSMPRSVCVVGVDVDADERTAKSELCVQALARIQGSLDGVLLRLRKSTVVLVMQDVLHDALKDILEE